MKPICVADFSKVPGPRYRSEGPHSGEKFRDEVLEPAFLAAEAANEQLEVRLDGVEFGYPTSFLEEAFGGLAREHGVERVQRTLVFHTTDEPLLELEVRGYITHANEVKPPQQRA